MWINYLKISFHNDRTVSNWKCEKYWCFEKFFLFLFHPFFGLNIISKNWKISSVFNIKLVFNTHRIQFWVDTCISTAKAYCGFSSTTLFIQTEEKKMKKILISNYHFPFAFIHTFTEPNTERKSKLEKTKTRTTHRHEQKRQQKSSLKTTNILSFTRF